VLCAMNFYFESSSVMRRAVARPCFHKTRMIRNCTAPTRVLLRANWFSSSCPRGFRIL